MKIYAQEANGDNNLERDYVLATHLCEVVEAIRTQGGYYTERWSDNTKEVFVPWHQIEFIEER
jgi:hypothetical protein